MTGIINAYTIGPRPGFVKRGGGIDGKESILITRGIPAADRRGSSGIVSVRYGDFLRLPGPELMGGPRISVPVSLNHRFMLPPTTPLGPVCGLLREYPYAIWIPFRYPCQWLYS